MRRCKYCRVEQPEEAFEVCATVKGRVYRRLKCQKCKRKTTNQRRTRLREWFDDYKRTVVCERCGFTGYRALQFHHRKKSGKDSNVADMIRSCLSIRTIRAEIAKCAVLCANCHQIEHYGELK